MASLVRPYLQWWDRKSNNNVDLFLPNSRFVQKRVQRFYEIGSNVVHPFVDLKDFEEIKTSEIKKENYFVMVTAFAPNKNVQLAIKTFNKLGLELRIIGCGTPKDTNYLHSISQPNINFLGNISREEVIDQLSKAKAFIFPGVEDFGIAPLEALAAGTPVIALKIGGVLETLNSDVAYFFENPTIEELEEAIKKSQSNQILKENLIKRAECFSKKNFIKNIEEKIQYLKA
jgi:glycosyltransferase involved in cell wall biosynthesis